MASHTVHSHRSAILAVNSILLKHSPDASQEMSKLKGTYRVGGMLSVITLLIVLTPDCNSQSVEICLYGI